MVKRQTAAPKALLLYAALNAEDRRNFNAAINEFLFASPVGRRRLVEQWRLDFARANGSGQQRDGAGETRTTSLE
jgi:hypothetical protein